MSIQIVNFSGLPPPIDGGTASPESAATSFRAGPNLESLNKAGLKHEKYEIVDQFPLGAGCAPGGDKTRDHGVFALSDNTGGDGGRGVRAHPRRVAQSLGRHPRIPRRVFS